MVGRIERLPQGLNAAERHLLDFDKAELRGDIAGRLRAQQAQVALDSSAVALLLVGVAATQLLRPDLAVPALEQSGPAYLLIGGTSARGQTTALAEAYHQAGRHDRELRTLVAQRALYSEYPDVARFRGRLLRAYAAQGRDAAALALADTMLRGGSDSSGVVLAGVPPGAQEFRAHGRAAAASQLLALARTWVAAHPARAPSPDRQLWEGIVLLASGLPDSAGVRFASVARDSSRLDAAGYLALAQVARGDGARARAAADSLGALPRRWLFGAQTFWRAAIVGTLGDRDMAVQLLQQANREGHTMAAWHYHAALEALHGYAPFEALVRPRR
ncbi:MAG: hypothetical protein WKG32_18025 [Gemmatimonadaceae bacterium]